MGILSWFKRGGNNDSGPLDGLVAGASRVRVCAVGEPTVYYETSARDELASLARALRTDPGDGGYCMCLGTLNFEFEADGRTTAISLHHGETLRWDDSDGNVPLRHPDAIMDWLSARCVTFVREEYETDRQRDKESAVEGRRWRSLMPASLAPFFEEMRSTGADEDPQWTAAIERELPDPTQRAAVLFALFGSGVGPWTGYPSYESVPEKLLVSLPLDVLLAAIGDAADERVREGAARLFSGFWFRRRRPDDRARLPAALKRMLLAHVEDSGDDDRRQRARNALAE